MPRSELTLLMGLWKKMNRGFTLIEFIIYIGILSIILVLVTGFLWAIIFGSIKESSFLEVQYSSRFALTKITQEIKKATGINNAGNNFLSLQMADPSLDPTIFDVNNGKLRIGQGPNPSYYNLTTDQTVVNNIRFTDLSYTNTPGAIRIEVEIEYVNPVSRIEYRALTDLKTTVSLLPGGSNP